MKESNERVAKLETAQKGLASDLQRLADSIISLGSDMRSSMDSLQQQIVDQNKTPWATLASWAGVVLIIWGLITASYVRDLHDLEAQVESQGISILIQQEKAYLTQIELIKATHQLELLIAR